MGCPPLAHSASWIEGRGHGLKPHLKRTFKLSNDPQFEARFWDVVGLYLDPPEKSIVLCCDEKTQIQALERSQPGLPLGTGHIRTETHDYVRHGTVTLFAAMNYLDGKLIERFFADLTAVIRDGSFTSVAELRREIVRHLAAHNEDPRPYKWTAKGEDILAKIKRARDRLADVHSPQS